MLGAHPSPSEQLDLRALALLYALLMFTSNAVLTSTTSIAVPLTQYYNITNAAVAEMPNLMFAAVYLVVGFAPTYVTRRLNLFNTLCATALTLTLGSLCRAVAERGFGWLMVGNALVAIVQPLVFANTSGVALYCMGESAQGTYIGVVLLVGLLGNAWGFVVSSWIIQSASDYGHYFGRIELLYLFLNAISTVGLALVCLRRRWRRSHPAATVTVDFMAPSAGPTLSGTTWPPPPPEASSMSIAIVPPSVVDVDAVAPAAPVHNTRQQYKYKLALSLIVASLLNGSTNSVIIILEPILLDRGYGSSQVFAAGVCYLVVSIPAPWLFGAWIDRTLAARVKFIVLAVFVGTSLLQILLINVDISIHWFYAVIAVYGIGGNVITTVFLAAANRWTDGRDADAINAVYIWLHTLITLALALCFTLVSLGTTSAVFWSLSIVCCVASVFLLATD